MTTYWLFSSWTSSFPLFTLLRSCYLWNSVSLDLSPHTGLHQVTLDLYYACVRVDTIVWSILFLDYTSVKAFFPKWRLQNYISINCYRFILLKAQGNTPQRTSGNTWQTRAVARRSLYTNAFSKMPCAKHLCKSSGWPPAIALSLPGG